MTRTVRFRAVFVLFAVLSAWTSLSWSQHAAPLESAGPEPAPPVVPAEAPPYHPEWAYGREQETHPRAATNTHRYEHSPEEGRYLREHVVNNPRGEMTHTWERVNTDEGFQYRRSHTWIGPDGVPIRQHEHTVSGTDPHNYTREHSLTLPGGRTLEQTHVHSWDGAEGTMERTFVGPNGQTRHFEHAWSPDEPAPSRVAPAPSADIAPATSPHAAGPPEKTGWWQKWNPFGEGSRPTGPPVAGSAPRRGFTIGTGNAGTAGGPAAQSQARPTVPASQDAHRPSWAGGAPRSAPQPGPPSHANGPAAGRANPGRGNSR